MQNFNLLRGRRYDYRRGSFAEETSRTRVRVAIETDFGAERPVGIEAGLRQRDGKPALASEVDRRKLTIGHTEECRVLAARKPRRIGTHHHDQIAVRSEVLL